MKLKLDDVKKLQQKKYRSEFGCFLAEGEHLVLELQKAAVKNPALLHSELYLTENHQHWNSSLNKHVISEKQMAQISDTKTPQGIVALVPFSALLNLPRGSANERAIYLHQIQDPGNLGSVLRTLAWFGGFRCLLSPDSVDPFNAKAVRASMGAIFHVPLEMDISLQNISERFQRIASLDMQGQSLTSAGFADHDCYVFGNEARGLPQESLQAAAYTINGGGSIESLNLAAAVNICVYELMRRD